MSANKNTSLGEILKKEYPHFIEYLDELENLRNMYTLYKVERNYVDYDDLLIYLKILLENDEIRDRLSRKYQYIMVDEYQDTNSIQGDIAYLLAEKHRNIMVVGDDAQSIYGFRGASHENIMQFPERFPECSIITLEENYRSTQPILDVANAVLENMKNKYSKCLVSAKHQAGDKPHLLFFKDVYEEAAWVADLIKQHMDEGMPLSHQCVLFRSMYLSIPLQSELSRRNIPYETYGGLKFYETAHVKDMMAHMKILVNPMDELAWNRVLMLIERIGPKTAGAITDEVMRYPSLNEMLDHISSRYSMNVSFSDGLGKLSEMLKRTNKDVISAGETFSLILEYYTPLLRDKYDDWHLRLNDLEALRQISMRYDELADLLEDFAIEPPERGVWGVDPETKDEEKPVVLSTIHSAKGLEWDSVVIMGLVDGVLPISFALGSEEEIEEEQRLFYVAITRAQNRCFLTLHHEGTRGGITQFNKISRFVDTPSVLARIELKETGHQERQSLVKAEEDESLAIYDKEALIKKLQDFYK